jgi:translation initiation factor 4A
MGSGEGESFFTEWEESFESFDQMGLHENLLRGIYAYGAPVRAAVRLARRAFHVT